MSQAKILIVDDKQENLIALSMLLKKLDVDIIAVNNGNKALVQVLKNDLALIILDVQMPEMDGFEVANLLHGDLKTHNIPIIFVTAAYNDELHVLAGYQSGAVDYIEKPINDVILLSKVRIFVRLWQQQKDLEHEIELRIQANKDIKYLATHDQLTGLNNRSILKDLIEKALSKAKRFDSIIALLFIDLDGFKNINDSYGHDVGDYILKVCSKRMINSIRGMDSIIRYGGDEFIALLTDLQSSDEALLSAERILSALIKPIAWKEKEIQVTASIGIAYYPEHGDSELSLIKSADKAMYSVKNKGKNNIAFLTEA